MFGSEIKNHPRDPRVWPRNKETPIHRCRQFSRRHPSFHAERAGVPRGQLGLSKLLPLEGKKKKKTTKQKKTPRTNPELSQSLLARAHGLAFKLPESAELRKPCALLEDGAVGSMTHLEMLAPLPGMFMVSESLPRFHRLRINIWMKDSTEA